MDRLDAILSMFDPNGFGLEIGASFNPVLRKAAGYAVEILDYVDTEQLRRLYPDAEIETVDYVSHGSSIADTIPHRGRYDYIIASHVIEHQPDIIGFLDDCTALLKPEGVLALVVPDKRRSFDMFMPLSTAGQALQAHLERRNRHTAAAIFDHHAYAVARSGNIVWMEGYAAEATFVHEVTTAQKAYAEALASTAYLDTHSWIFTPSSFRLLVRDLHTIHALALNEAAFIPGDGPEFYIALSRRGTGCATERINLMRQITAEMRATID